MLEQFEAQWDQLKSTVKARWAKLTDEDLARVAGKKDKLVGKIRERYGFARSEAARQADDSVSKQALGEEPSGKNALPKTTAQPPAAGE